ncbi:MAG: Fic family protein [Saprospiraceae bacterium]|nr:Fic family protein [Saprospiraceae bacterium]
MLANFSIIPTILLEPYHAVVGEELMHRFEALTEAEISTNSFSFYTSVASVFSSKIEGEEIDLDSYVKHKRFGIEFQPDYTKKTDDLYDAYVFAQQNALNPENIATAHALLSKHLVVKHQQGKLRTQNMYVTSPNGKIEYVAASPHEVEIELQKLYADIEVLLNADLSIKEVFYFAASIHLVFVKIHPFIDGNGRTARLLEKWFLGEKLGTKAWFVQSEKNYYEHHQTYYNNLRALGLEYPELDYKKALPFLLMLPGALKA